MARRTQHPDPRILPGFVCGRIPLTTIAGRSVTSARAQAWSGVGQKELINRDVVSQSISDEFFESKNP